jgi:hypothetical protein
MPARLRRSARPDTATSRHDSARARADLDTFIARFTPEIAARVHSIVRRMRARLPGAVEFVYDNYYALVIGYGPTDRPSEALFSIVALPKKVSLCFLQGAKLAKGGGDPKGLLRGGGNQVRNVQLPTPAVLGSRDIRALMTRAIAASPKRFDSTVPIRTVIRGVVPHQRRRRPAQRA